MPRSDPGEVNGDDGSSAAFLGKRFFNYRTALSFVVAFVIIGIAFSRINVDPGDIVDHVRTANLGLYLLAFFVYYLSFPVRAIRWRLLLSNVGYAQGNGTRLPGLPGLIEIIFLSWFANCIVPAKLGDATRGYLLRRASNVSFSRTMGTVLAERVVDMLVLFVAMGLAGLAIFRGHLPDVVVYLFSIGGMLIVAIVLALVSMKRFGRRVEALLPHRARDVYARFEEGTLQSFRKLPLVFLLTLLVWSIEGARLWLILSALGLAGVSPLVVIFTTLAASLLTTVPFTPAGLGLVESGIVAILLFMGSLGQVPGVTEGLAGSIALLDRTITYLSIVVLGTFVYILSRKK